MNCRPLLLILGATAAMAVLVYNYWAYCCGRCTMRGFLTFGPVELLLIGVTALAALVWFGLKRRSCRRLALSRCNCGERLADDWTFCPRCGLRRASHP